MATDVAQLIANRLIDALDGVQWDWDDIARTAAALTLASGRAAAPVLAEVAQCLWRATDDALSVKGTVSGILHNEVISSAAYGKTLGPLRTLARAAGLSVRSPATIASLRAALRDPAVATRAVGPHCSIHTSLAQELLDLCGRWITSTHAAKVYGLSKEYLEAAGCRSAGAAYGGTRWFLSDVRRAARALIAEGDVSVRAAVAKTAKSLQGSGGVPYWQKVRERITREEQEREHFRRERERASQLLKVMSDETGVRGLLAELLSQTVDAKQYTETGSDAALEAMLDAVRTLCEALHHAGFDAPFDSFHSNFMPRLYSFSLSRRWAVSELQQRFVREVHLKLALQSVGLRCRSDSAVCEQYVTGARDDLQEVVEIMREMNWFFNETDYGNIRSGMGKRRRSHYYFRDFDSDWGDSSDGDEDFEEYMPPTDPVALSQQAKVSALKALASKRPIPSSAPINVLRLAVQLGLRVQ